MQILWSGYIFAVNDSEAKERGSQEMVKQSVWLKTLWIVEIERKSDLLFGPAWYHVCVKGWGEMKNEHSF